MGFVENLNNSKEEHAKLEEAKTELESMKTQLSKYRVKDENQMQMSGGTQVSLLQGKIEELTTRLASLAASLAEAEADAVTKKAANVEQLVLRIEEEKARLDEYIDKA